MWFYHREKHAEDANSVDLGRSDCSSRSNLIWSTLFAYRNVPKFSDRQVWANSADPDQTAPRSSLIKVYSLQVPLHFSDALKEKSSCSTFMVITANFRVSEILGFLG